jgi:Zn ribbon nucleic-acid-binding protein
MTCPACQSTDTAPIIYGMATSPLFEKEQRHEIKIGGCDIWHEDPTQYCFACGHKWGRLGDESPQMFR